MKAKIFFADGLEEIEGLTVVDMLRRAGISIDIISITGNLTVTGSHQIAITADALFENTDFSDTDVLILPGGMPGTKHLRAYKPLCDLLTASANDKYLAAICAAPSVLGELHLLQDHKATCYPGFENSLIGAQVSADSAVVDGHRITGRGMGAAIDFAAEIITIMKDRETADKITASIMYTKK